MLEKQPSFLIIVISCFLFSLTSYMLSLQPGFSVAFGCFEILCKHVLLIFGPLGAPVVGG